MSYVSSTNVECRSAGTVEDEELHPRHHQEPSLFQGHGLSRRHTFHAGDTPEVAVAMALAPRWTHEVFVRRGERFERIALGIERPDVEMLDVEAIGQRIDEMPGVGLTHVMPMPGNMPQDASIDFEAGPRDAWRLKSYTFPLQRGELETRVTYEPF